MNILCIISSPESPNTSMHSFLCAGFLLCVEGNRVLTHFTDVITEIPKADDWS